jgi:hypothetical protein
MLRHRNDVEDERDYIAGAAAVSELRSAAELPMLIGQPETRRWYAWMLIDRNAPGDRDRARELLTEAIERYRRLGMPMQLELAQGLLAKT